MTMKQPREARAWEWHQDFGYWYNNGCLTPDRLSIYIALDKSNAQNTCLQFLSGSLNWAVSTISAKMVGRMWTPNT